MRPMMISMTFTTLMMIDSIIRFGGVRDGPKRDPQWKFENSDSLS